MAKIWTEEEIVKKLSEISASLPENLRRNVVREVKMTPTMEKIVLEAINTESIPKEKRESLKALYDNGDFSRTKPVENKRIAAMIDNYYGRKINEAVKKGELPSKSELMKMPHMIRLLGNYKQNG